MKSYIKSIPLKTELPYPDYWEQPMIDPISVIKPKYWLRVLNGQRQMHRKKSVAVVKHCLSYHNPEL